jgi:hypothetical protein
VIFVTENNLYVSVFKKGFTLNLSHVGACMLVKIENGFYLNSHHIIAIRVAKCDQTGHFIIHLEYTPNSMQKVGNHKISFATKAEAENYLHTLNQALK